MKNDQRGFAALIIAITLVIILSLITVGFATLMRHEQTSALNRQLSNAAYYAAESGINDANRAIAKGFTGAKTDCKALTSDPSNGPGSPNASGSWQYLADSNVDSGDGTQYTCLLINPYPSTLEYSSVANNQATTTVLTGVSPSNPDVNVPIAELAFGWQDANGGTIFTPSACNNNSCFPPAGNGGSSAWPNSWSNGGAITGVLRAAVTPLTSGGLNADTLAASTYTAFLYPSTSSTNSSLNYQPATASGDIANGGCTTHPMANSPTARFCNVTISFPSGSSVATYLLHLSSIYQATRVTVTAFDKNGNQLDLKGAQTMIDSTGEAQGTLKRIQVREPVNSEYDVPEYDVETSQSICKLLSVTPTNNATGTPGTAPSGCGTL